MGVEPGGTILGQHRIQELVPTMAERHEEGMYAAHPLGVRVEPARDIEKVDLGFRARWRVVEPHGHARSALHAFGPLPLTVAVKRAPTGLQAVLVTQALVQHAEAHRADVLGQIRVEGGHIAGHRALGTLLRNLAQDGLREVLPLGFAVAPTAPHQAHTLRCRDILAHRGAAVVQRAGNGTHARATIPMHQNLFHISHNNPPSPHDTPPCGGLSLRSFRMPGGKFR